MIKFSQINENINIRPDKRMHYGDIFVEDLECIIRSPDVDDAEWQKRISEVIELLNLLKDDNYEELEKRYPSNI